MIIRISKFIQNAQLDQLSTSNVSVVQFTGTKECDMKLTARLTTFCLSPPYLSHMCACCDWFAVTGLNDAMRHKLVWCCRPLLYSIGFSKVETYVKSIIMQKRKAYTIEFKLLLIKEVDEGK